MMVRAVAFLWCLFVAGAALAQPKVEDADFSAELPRIPATEPADARTTMKVQEGFEMDLVAHEPLVASPVAMAWDEQSRMFIVEMRGYSEHRDEGISRIRLLSDKNGDGKYDDASIYVDNLLWPTAVCCWDGGIFVGDAPDLWYFKDTDNDGVADVKRKVFTGFSTSNVQGLFNTFLWGLDNRIHGAGSSTGGSIKLVERLDGTPAPENQTPVNINGRDFSFDPITLDFRTETGGAQHGMTFDDWGNKYVCHNSDHVIRCVIDDAYLARNPLFAAPPPKTSIAIDGPQATIFRSSPVEPWRIVRTRLRASGAVPGILEGGGRAAGYFTSATGVTSVRGDAFDYNMRGALIIGDVGSNVIHRKRVLQKGIEQTAERIDQGSELVASTDIWFRPAQYANGPDGGLYIADVYREVIEHPASLPPVIKKHLDLDSGRDRGRIWRLRPNSFVRRKPENLGTLTDEQLIVLLKHENAWHRETAARLFYQRQSTRAAPALSRLVADRQALPLGRMHAAYALAGLRQLKASDLAPLFDSQEPMLRKHAVRLAETFPADSKEIEPVAARLALLTEEEPDQRVRFQLALALGNKTFQSIRQANGMSPLVGILAQDGDNAWVRAACFTSLPSDLKDVFQSIEAHRQTVLTPKMKLALPQLVALAARDFAHIDENKIPDTLKAICQGDPALSRRMLVEFTSTLARSGKQLDPSVNRDAWNAFVDETIEESLRSAADSKAEVEARADAIRGTTLAPFAKSRDLLKSLIVPTEPASVVVAALSSLDTYNDPEVASIVLEAWPSLSPEARRRGGEILMARAERVDLLLKALEEKTLSVAELERSQLETLKKQPNDGLRARAEKLLATASEPKRGEVVEKYKSALTSEGDLIRGKAAFAKNCSSCHKVEGVGNEIGPSLAAMKNRGPEAILVNVLDPNREVNPQYLAYSATTNDGRTRSGLIAAESAGSITLRKTDGQAETILRADLEELRSTGLSLMPEGLEKEIDTQMMADLLTYLMKSN
jgi:putative membrane-bound dehydrogenase-like protein